ncbi:MAG: metal-dependent hydrolase [Candidatus Hadarchaeia archaeon]
MKRNTHIAASIIFAIFGTILINILLNGTLPDSITNFIYFFLNMRVYIFLIMIVFSVLGGILPDILDPPFTKKHRRYAHSKILLVIFSTLLLFTVVLIFIKREKIILWPIYYFLIGYISHLVLDSFTPAGLWG